MISQRLGKPIRTAETAQHLPSQQQRRPPDALGCLISDTPVTCWEDFDSDEIREPLKTW